MLVVGSSCGLIASLRPGPTIAPLISAKFLSVHLFVGDNGDAQEKARLPGLRDSIAGALPSAWATAKVGRGQLSLRTDGVIDVVPDGTRGTSALTRQTLGAKLVARTIAQHP